MLDLSTTTPNNCQLLQTGNNVCTKGTASTMIYLTYNSEIIKYLVSKIYASEFSYKANQTADLLITRLDSFHVEIKRVL